MGIFCVEKNAKPSRETLYLVYRMTLNLIFSASRQIIKNLVGNFGALSVGSMHANFQPSSFNGVGGRGGDRRTRDIICHTAKLPLLHSWDNLYFCMNLHFCYSEVKQLYLETA